MQTDTGIHVRKPAREHLVAKTTAILNTLHIRLVATNIRPLSFAEFTQIPMIEFQKGRSEMISSVRREIKSEQTQQVHKTTEQMASKGTSETKHMLVASLYGSPCRQPQAYI